MARLAEVVPIHLRRSPQTEVERLRAELSEAHEQIAQLTATVADQAKTLAAITDDAPPWAPSLAIVYWLWAETMRYRPSWHHVWNRVSPLIRLIGDLPAPLLTPLRWDQHRAVRRTEPTHLGACPKDITLNMELSRAKQMLTWAERQGLIKRNPLIHARHVPTIIQRETRLTLDDLERLLIAADDIVDKRKADGEDDGRRAKQLKAFMLCCFDSMLRFGEAHHLRRDRIREDGSYELLASETKSKRRRLIRLTPRSLSAITAIEPVAGTSYIFVHRTGKLVNDTTIRAWFRRACEISGVDERATPLDKRVRPHDMRAGGATAADENGARATAIRTALGHSRMSVTERYLRSEAEDNARHVAEVMVQATTPVRFASRRGQSAKREGR